MAHHELGVASVLCGDPADGVAHLDRAWRMGAFGARTWEPAPAAHGPDPEDWRRRLKRKVEELTASPFHRSIS